MIDDWMTEYRMPGRNAAGRFWGLLARLLAAGLRIPADVAFIVPLLVYNRRMKQMHTGPDRPSIRMYVAG